ncbi:MAG: hypothetical protein HQL17_05040 [Candidatus Omnitrophica bacterium]|nr:hypothetical protein [Candidatus Omnitrophota bacterium]
MDKIVVLQDEVFFVQNELTQLKKALAEKDEAFKSAVIENASSAAKINSLQLSLLQRDNDLPRLMEQAGMVYRAQINDMKDQLKAMTLTLAQKTEQVSALEGEKTGLQAKIDMQAGERISLRQSLKTVADEADALKRELSERAAHEMSVDQVRENEFKLRLSREQSLMQEKITAAKKPIEDKVVLLEGQLKVKDAYWTQRLSDEKTLLEDKVHKLEQQIAVLRAGVGQEIKRAQDAAAAEIQKIKDELAVCRSGKK